ncbi:glyoxal reductase [Brachionus plicatilis]|uniref:Glyoxal reductase n=1 Tax=Brachionus plicatilis TaxID=10195 RepID=A0A3M7SLW3_BRAPC|nr:glyoxal reductase [Brachionus plicatilis]
MLDKTVELKNGIKMPTIGLGTSLRHKPNKVDNQQFVESVKHALKIGYRHLDTAKCYNNEHLIGQAIKESGIDRKDVFLVTKLFPDDMGYDKTLKAFDKSCKQLKVEYIDLYLIHFPAKLRGQNNDLEKSRQVRLETWKALEKLHSDGKCRAIGVSNFMQRHLEEIIDAGMTIPSVNQCEFHPYYNNRELYDYCTKIGIQFEGYSPLGKGNLLNDPVVLELSKKYSKSCAQILLNWSIRNNVVTIPGSTNHERIEENFNIFDFSLSDEDVGLLWTLNKNEKVSWDPTNII